MQILLTILFVACNAMTLAQGLPTRQPLKIVISAEKSAFKPGEPIRVKVELTNTSSGDVNVGSWIDLSSGIRMQHIYDVRKDTGETVPKKEKAQPQPPAHTGDHNWLRPAPPEPAETGKIVLGSLKPGQEYTSVDEISRAYNLSVPGKYTIQLAHPWPGKENDDVVKSNKITITIMP